jgi:hypothetical protein
MLLVRSSSSTKRGANSALITRTLPADTATVRGVHWAGLGRGELGRALFDLFNPSTDWLAEFRRACKEPVEEAFDWFTMARPSGDRLGDGTTLVGMAWDEDRINRCAREYAAQLGSPLRVRIEGNLRIYELGEGRSFVVAWLDPRTVIMSSSWEGDRQRAVLEEVATRTAPAPGNDQINELLNRIDTGATLWTATRRPPPDAATPTSDTAADWLSEELSSLLGARPDAIYAAADIGEAVDLDAGALYATEDKAERVLSHVSDYLKLRRSAPSTPAADLSGYPPAVRDALERRLAQGAGSGSALREALLDNVKVDRRGRYVTFDLSLSAATVDKLIRTRSARSLIDEVNSWLPDALKLGP